MAEIAAVTVIGHFFDVAVRIRARLRGRGIPDRCDYCGSPISGLPIDRRYCAQACSTQAWARDLA